jgi:putative aldouronate transport system permease protein
LRRYTKEDIVINTVIYFVLLIVLIAVLLPFYYVFILSFNSGIDTQRGYVYFFPRNITLDNYKFLFIDNMWLYAFLISVLRTLVGTIFEVTFTSFVAYGLSKKQLLFRKTYYRILIMSMYFSGGIIPFYILIKTLGLMNNFFVYIIPPMLSQFFVLVMVAFYSEIPVELSESAYLDGANELIIFLKIIIPVSLPIIATVSLFTAVNHWNSWFDSAFFVQNEHLKTLSYRMMELITRNIALTRRPDNQKVYMATITPKSIQSASIIITVLPIIMVYPFVQKYFIKGIMLGSVKG